MFVSDNLPYTMNERLTHQCLLIKIIILLVLTAKSATTISPSVGFVSSHNSRTICSERQRRHSTCRLWGKAKRGRLGSITEDVQQDNQMKKQSSKSTKTNKASNKVSSVSPDLLSFFEKQDDISKANQPVMDEDDANQQVDSEAATFTDFQSVSKKNRNARSASVRQQLDVERAALVAQVVADLEIAIVQQKNDQLVNSVLQALLKLPVHESINYKAIPKPTDYRLVWAGSDKALCAIGTGLFNVPLARLQEVFLTLGKNQQIQWLEVIRILGPFPNVRNSLSGTCRVSNNNKPWQIAWESLVDATGKEVYADEVRNIELFVYYCDEQLLVTTSSGSSNLNDKESILVFVKDEAMDEALERYRVA